MFLLISCYTTLATSAIVHAGYSLKIINESTVSPFQVSSYSDSIFLEIISDSEVEIKDHAFRGFSNIKRLNVSCPKISIASTSFSDSNNIQYMTFNNTDLFGFPPNCFSGALEEFHYTGENFYASSIIFLANKTKEFNVTVTGNCTFYNGESYLDQKVEKLIINANIVNFEQSSFRFPVLYEFDVNAIDSIYFGSYSVSSSSIRRAKFNAGKQIVIEGGGFALGSIDSEEIDMVSNGTINMTSNAFFNTQTQTIHIESKGDIIIGDNAFSRIDTDYISIFSKEGGIFIEDEAFSSASSEDISITAHKDIIFGRGINFENNTLSLPTNKSILSSGEVKSFYISSKENVIFNSFRPETSFEHLTIYSQNEIRFESGAFQSADISTLDINPSGPLNFANHSFGNNCRIGIMYITTDSNITFEPDSLRNSKIGSLKLFVESKSDQNSTDNIVILGKQSFSSCKLFNSIQLKHKGTIYIDENTFENDEQLSDVQIYALKKIHIGNYAFINCDPDCYYYFDSKEKEISKCGRGGNCGKKKGGGCSPKNDDWDPVFNAQSLGDIKIKTVYLGLSPTIIVNLDFFINLMKKARKLFGHIIPPPDLIHSAIWVGESDATDDSVGAIFVYGKYYNERNDNSYLVNDGARAYVMTLKDFKAKYSVGTMKLKPNKNINLFDFIEKLKLKGKLTADEYNWPTNNCQHFTASCLNILQAIREIPNKDDWINLPLPIMKTLQLHEKDDNN